MRGASDQRTENWRAIIATIFSQVGVDVYSCMHCLTQIRVPILNKQASGHMYENVAI